MHKKTSLAGVLSVAALIAAAPTATANESVDLSAHIQSSVPVPGGFTAGSWSIDNASVGTMPAGATFIVTFTRLPNGPVTGTTTVTTRETSQAKVQGLSGNTYRVTLTQPLRSGQRVTGYWSDAHWFNIGQRDKVTISPENLPAGTTEINSANDASTYDNSGQGF